MEVHRKTGLRSMRLQKLKEKVVAESFTKFRKCNYFVNISFHFINFS